MFHLSSSSSSYAITMTKAPSMITRSLYRSLRRILATLDVNTTTSRNDDQLLFAAEAAKAAARQSLILSRSGIGDGPPPLTKPQSRQEQQQQAPQEEEQQQRERKELVNKLWRTCLKQAMPRGACFCFPHQIISRNHSSSSSSSQAQSSSSQLLTTLLKREFRETTRQITASTTANVRQDLAFHALRILNTKQAALEELTNQQRHQQQQQHPEHVEQQQSANNIIAPAPHVQVLPRFPPAAYLQPGTFLVAHPLRTGYFARTVICLVDHQDEDNRLDALESNTGHPGQQRLGTYGLVVNRYMNNPRGDPDHGPGPTTLQRAMKPLEDPWIKQAFGNVIVREGGPAYSALQMMHAASTAASLDPSLPPSWKTSEHASSSSSSNVNETQDAIIGGIPLPRASWPPREIHKSNIIGTDLSGENPATGRDSATTSEDAGCTTSNDEDNMVIKFQGDTTEAAKAILNNQLDGDNDTNNDTTKIEEHKNVAIFMGATSWSVGQLQVEVEKGLWLPTAAPPVYALRGATSSSSSSKSSSSAAATLASDSMSNDNIHDDFYLCMLAACGPGEAQLAQMIQNVSVQDQRSDNCLFKSLWTPCDEID